MVNYKRVVCEVAVFATLMATAAAAPAADCPDRMFDQRQNGTENYRLNIDGVVIAVAPAESLLAAASDIDISDLLGDLDDFSEFQKPQKPSNPVKPIQSAVKPDENKPEAANPLASKPQDSKPEVPEKPVEAPLTDVSLDTDSKPLKKDASTRKHEKAQKLKNRLAHILLPLLRRNRHQ